MATIEVPIPQKLQFRKPDGSPITVAGDSVAQVSIQRVVHPSLDGREKLPDDTPQFLRLDHRFADVSQAPFRFTSFIPATFIWDQLYENEAYVNRQQLMQRDFRTELAGPWDEQVIVDEIRSYDDLRDFRAFRVHPANWDGHPDTVPLFTKHHSWRARIAYLHAPHTHGFTGTVRVFLVTFTDTRIFTALRDVSSGGEDECWKQFDLSPPFHYCVRADAWLWKDFSAPEKASNSWCSVSPSIICTPEVGSIV